MALAMANLSDREAPLSKFGKKQYPICHLRKELGLKLSHTRLNIALLPIMRSGSLQLNPTRF